MGDRLGDVRAALPFWQTRIDSLGVEVEPSTWVRDVLPGLWLDRSRLIEVNVPPALPGGGSGAREWDKAREALDTRRYRDCVERGRGVIRLWVDALGASAKRRVATIIAERRGWPEGDPAQPGPLARSDDARSVRGSSPPPTVEGRDVSARSGSPLVDGYEGGRQKEERAEHATACSDPEVGQDSSAAGGGVVVVGCLGADTEQPSDFGPGHSGLAAWLTWWASKASAMSRIALAATKPR